MSGVQRCGLDLDHEAHEWLGGHCDGGILDGVRVAPGEPLAKLYVVSDLPRPWVWASLTYAQAAELRELLDGFAEHYNATYAVRDTDLILGCWSQHPGLAHELAALYGLHVHLFQSGLASVVDAAGWFDRWLPGFQQRLPRWFGTGPDTCTPGNHRNDWNPASRKREAAKDGPPEDLVEDALRALVTSRAHLDTGG